MATPTPTAMKHAPSQQGRTPSQSQSQHAAGATPPVSTPFSTHAHAAFSPLGPRSSPQQVKKSPANSATLMGHTVSSSGIAGGASSVPASYDSPAAAAIGALGINNGLDMSGLDHVSVSGLSNLGGLGRNDEDERARRLQAVLDMLKKNKGRVSEAGLERLAKSMGLECLWEEGMGASAGRTLIVAGTTLTLDIVVSNNIVESVTVSFPLSQSIVLRHVERANQILLDDLKLRPDESPLNKTLDGFAANLERLAALDKLSVQPGANGEPGLNLYEAVAGIYEALDKLYRWDLQKLREDPANSGKAEAELETLAECARHGRPTMHEHAHLGLGLYYWKQRHLVPSRQPRTQKYAETNEKAWGVLLGCIPTNGLVYQPVRLSDKWLSDAIEKPSGLVPGGGIAGSDADPILDWLEPEDTFVAPAPPEGGDASGKDASNGNGTSVSGPKLPEVMFHAVFSPPLAVPFSVWHHIYELVGLAPEPEIMATFDALSFPIAPGSQHDPSEPRTIACDKDVHFSGKGGGGGAGSSSSSTTTIKHRHTLFIYKPVYGRSMTELPFSHPSQLVRMLPMLRQYAFLATILETGFQTKMSSIVEEPPSKTAATVRSKTVTTSTIMDEFEAFTRQRQQQQQPENGSQKDQFRVPGEGFEEAAAEDRIMMDVVLTAHPVPRLQAVFPFRHGTADIMLEIGTNAQVHVISQNIFADDEDGEESQDKGKGKGKRLEPQDLGRMLEVCEDLGIWCEWIRTRCA